MKMAQLNSADREYSEKRGKADNIVPEPGIMKLKTQNAMW